MHFLKVLDTSSNEDKRLELPKEFTVKYRTELSENAIIKVPNGIWRIGLKKAQGAISFENGWPEFMEFYSICVGHVTLFRYDGDSEFQVYIFGIDATEIDYPSHIDNHEVEMTSTRSDEDEVEVVSIHSGSTQSNYEPSISSESSYDQKAEPARQEFSHKTPKQRTVIPRKIHTKASKASLEAAEAFKSENPSFKRILQASHLEGILKVPIAFVRSYLKNIPRMMISLRISDGRTWEVGYVSRPQNGRPESLLSKGWYKFVADNYLKEGDVCVFELVDRKKIEMIVHIFRQQRTSAKKLTPKIKYYTTEFQATLKAAGEFRSENPFFKIVMQASYIKRRLVRVPAVFGTSHLKNITQMVITLRVPDGRTWEVGYVSQTPTERRISKAGVNLLQRII